MVQYSQDQVEQSVCASRFIMIMI